MARKGEFQDLTGKRFGRWTAVARQGEYKRFYKGVVCAVPIWLCRCDCGTEKDIRADTLRSGRAKGCSGCAVSCSGQKKHHDSYMSLYRRYASLKNGYRRMRGIPMLESWYISYHVFKEWAISQGYKDGDKIMVKKGAACLSPDTVMVVPNIYTRARIEPPIGLSKVTIHKRIHKLGWSVEKALSTPSRVRKKK